MSYDFSKVLELTKYGIEQENLRRGTHNQAALFKDTIQNISAKTANIDYKKKAKQVAELFFPQGNDITQSELLNSIATASDKVVLEKFDNLYGVAKTERPSRFEKAPPLKEVRKRIKKLGEWAKTLSDLGVISPDKLKSFENEYEKLVNLLNATKKAQKTIISTSDSLIQEYNRLNEMLLISNLTERIAFLAEKGVAQILNTTDTMAQKVADEVVISQFHQGSAKSKTQISTKGMTEDMIRQLGALGYGDSGVTGILEYKSATYDKADLRFDLIVEDITDQFGVSLKTGGEAFGLQGSSRLAAYLTQSLFLEEYTNNLLGLMGQKQADIGIKTEEEFQLAKNMIVFTALMGYESQGEHQAELMMHVDTQNKSVSFYPVSEAISNLIEHNLKGVDVTSNVSNLFSIGSLPNIENSFLSTTVKVQATNINKMLKNDKYTYAVK